MAPKTEKFKLKDPKTTFFDPETRLKVTGKEAVEIDPRGRGKLTLAAINAGGLIEVGTKASDKDDPDSGPKDKAPKDKAPAK